jgi:hypothetical protein
MVMANRMIEPALEIGSAAVAGGLQRIAWEQSNPIGFMVTGATVLGGLVMSMFTTGPAAVMARGIASSGGSVAGWTISENFLLLGNGKNNSGATSRIPSGVRRSVNAGQRVPAAGARRNTEVGPLLFTKN